MRSVIAVAALAGLGAAQNLDIAAIQAAPPPPKTKAPIAAMSDSVSHSSALALAVGAGAVPHAQRRSLRKRAQSSTSVTSTPSTMNTVASSSATLTSSSITTTTVTRGTTTTSSVTSSSTSACPTTPEPGTYCGFINPEDPCAPQPDGFGLAVLKPDTAAAFQAYQPFHSQAQQATDPDAAYVKTCSDLNGGISQNSYIGLYTLASYDVQGCSKLCDTTDLCTSFNIYIERDPSLNPAGNCKMPASITNYKCTLWGSGLQAVAATNTGGYRGDFQVVIIGSDCFDKTNNTTPPTPAGFGDPQRCPNGAVNNAAINVAKQFFSGPFDVNLCAGFASAYNDADSSKGANQAVAINAYNVYKNGVAQGTYCALYSQAVDCSQANYQPGDMNGNYMSVQNSFILKVPAKKISQSASATASVVTVTESTTSTSVTTRPSAQGAQGTSTTSTSTVTPSSSVSSSSSSTSTSQSSISSSKTTTTLSTSTTSSSSVTPSSSKSSSSSASPTNVSTTTVTSATKNKDETKTSSATPTKSDDSGDSKSKGGDS